MSSNRFFQIQGIALLNGAIIGPRSINFVSFVFYHRWHPTVFFVGASFFVCLSFNRTATGAMTTRIFEIS
jgi:hypothetical protein